MDHLSAEDHASAILKVLDAREFTGVVPAGLIKGHHCKAAAPVCGAVHAVGERGVVPVCQAPGVDPLPIVEQGGDGLDLLGVEVACNDRAARGLGVVEGGMCTPADVVDDEYGVYGLVQEHRVGHGPVLQMVLETHPRDALKLPYLGGEPAVEPGVVVADGEEPLSL